MMYKNLINEVCKMSGSFGEAYKAACQKDVIDEASGPHTVFSLVFVPLLLSAIDAKDDNLIQELVVILEKMITSSDQDVCEVAEFTVLEELCDELNDDVLNAVLLEQSQKSLKIIRRYVI